MSTFRKPTKSIEDIFHEDGRYPLGAVQFVREGLNHAVAMIHGAREGEGPRHVSGAQLCQGLRELACKRWGFLAKSVLNRWNLHTTRDFGEVIFLLVEHGWMQKQLQDCVEDFDDVYDFSEAFEGDFEITPDNS